MNADRIKIPKPRKTAAQHLASNVGTAVLWGVLIWSIGGCCALMNHDAKAPLVVINAGK